MAGTPPDVLFNRYFQERYPFVPPVRPEDPDPRTFRGIDDLSNLPPEFVETLRDLQGDFIRALQNAQQDVPKREDSPIHFDYIDSTTRNALAFSYEHYSFIGVTIPLLREIEDTSKRLCRDEGILNILSLDDTLLRYEAKALWATLVRIQILFAVSHEYGHHVNGDAPGLRSEATSVFFSEIEDAGEIGNLDQQVSEINADGIATYLLLSDLMDGGGRRQVIRALKLGDTEATVQDEALLVLFVVAVVSFFVLRKVGSGLNLHAYTHPPQPARTTNIGIMKLRVVMASLLGADSCLGTARADGHGIDSTSFDRSSRWKLCG